MLVNAIELKKALRIFGTNIVDITFSSEGIAITKDSMTIYVPKASDEGFVRACTVTLDVTRLIELLIPVRAKSALVAIDFKGDGLAFSLNDDDTLSEPCKERSLIQDLWVTWGEEIEDLTGFYTLCQLSKEIGSSPYIPMSGHTHIYGTKTLWQMDVTSVFENILYRQPHSSGTLFDGSTIRKSFDVSQLQRIADVVKELKPKGAVMARVQDDKLLLGGHLARWQVEISLQNSKEMLFSKLEATETIDGDNVFDRLIEEASDIRYKERRLRSFPKPCGLYETERFFSLSHGALQYTVSKKRTTT